MAVAGQGALVRCVDEPFVPDRGGQSQKFGRHPGVDAFKASPAMMFQTQLVFQGVKDRLDPLPDPTQSPEPGARPAGPGG